MKQRWISGMVAAMCLTMSSAFADEASVRNAFMAKYPKANVESIKRLPELGLYEIVIPRADEPLVIYTDEEFRFMAQGSLVDTKTMIDVAEKTRNRLSAIDFDSLPLDRAIKKVKGKGERRLVVFSDADCPFCKRLEEEMKGLDNVTVYTFLFPIDQLHPEAARKSRQIWCSADKVKTWNDWMQRDVTPKGAGSCNTDALTANLDFAKKYRITGTPTLVFEGGQRVPGAINAQQIEELLAKN